ncbi:TonB-dependent receptor domain-containing protein [Bordetella sp. 15P40C-2]|uniref:TonB-dependent receptor domain-containing protein n=1 Tax=Bordetella sp. 15P40C-2 TaxID=2572246 RepID=UPI00132B9ABF|nr:TonB-dependent receptor [Bordetella sp. 15P40C-2]MVW70944.1 TonB-dependent receptor [Bordetella sp. 15P40C-2]
MTCARTPAHVLLPNTLAVAILASFTGTVVAQSADADNVTVMDNVVVTASGFEQNVADAPASISVIPREKLEQGSYRDLNDALRDVPGLIITSNSDNNGRGDISLRGMGSAYTLILVDGKRTTTRETQNNGSTGTDQSWTPPLAAIDRIEVVRGPMSSLYGSDAMGGVVNIITRKVAEEWTGQVRAETTLQQHSHSGDEQRGNVYLSGPIKTDLLGISLYGAYSHRDEDDIFEGYNKARNFGGTVKLALTPTKDHDIVLEGEGYKQRFDSRVGKTQDPEDSSSLDATNRFERERYALSHTGRWTQRFITDSYVQREKTKNLSRDMTVENTVLSTNATYLFDRNTTMVGAYYEKNDLTDTTSNTLSNLSAADRWQYAFFAENEWRMTDAFALTTGLRWDKEKTAGDHWSPRIYGVYHLNENWTVKGGVSTGFKAPSIRQTIGDWGNSSRGGDRYGNPNLKPEKSITKEIGLLYSGDSGLQTSLTLFTNDFKDKITRVSCPECGPPNRFGSVPTTYQNVDDAVTRGVEASFSAPLTRTVSINSSYTYTYSKQKSGQYAGKPLNQLPKHMFNLGADWQATESINAWARLHFRGKESDATTTPSSGGEFIAPSYTLVDLGGSYKLNKNVTMHAGIYNLLDKDINYDDYQFVEDGRRLWLAMDIRF